MTPHPISELSAMAAGHQPPPHVVAHLDGCADCRTRLDLAVPLDVGAVWARVGPELHAPRPSIAERSAVRAGIDPTAVRIALAAPSMSGSWVVASALVLALGAALASTSASLSVMPVLVVAPVVAAVSMAFAYGPDVDPAHEVMAVTPYDPGRVLLARLVAVLGCNAVIAAAVDLLLPGDRLGAAWLLPMTTVALLAALVAAVASALVGAVVGGVAWVLLLAALTADATGSLAVLAAAPAQGASAALAAALLAALLRGFAGRPRQAA